MASMSLNQREMRKLLKELRSMDVKLQKKVFTQSLNATTRRVVLPAVKAKINARSIDIPLLPYKKRGLRKPMHSHDAPAGSLKRLMKVRAIKRTRTAVGRLVATPPREELDIPKEYPGYYPSFLEYGSGRARAKPYLRGTLESKKEAIETFFLQDARRRMKKVYK